MTNTVTYASTSVFTTTVHAADFGMPARARVLKPSAAAWVVVSGPATLARITDSFQGSAWSPPI